MAIGSEPKTVTQFARPDRTRRSALASAPTSLTACSTCLIAQHGRAWVTLFVDLRTPLTAVRFEC